MHMPQIVTYVVVEKGMRRTKVSFDKTMMQALELLRLAKSTSLDNVTLIGEEVKPVAIATKSI